MGNKYFVKPLVAALKPKTLVEIGCSDGTSTRELLQYSREKQATLHVIDKQPGFDVEELAKEHQPHLVFHQALALNVLGDMGPVDLVIIDGDPNWYTVFNELKMLEKGAEKHGHPFPCVVINHVGWPYGRRDAYQDPEVIPEAHRQAFKQQGVLPGKDELSETGIFPETFHAEREDQQKNGVLTAVEDFIKEQSRSLEWVSIPAHHGLGLLFPGELKKSNSDFASVVESLSLPPMASALVEKLEEARINAEVELAAVRAVQEKPAAGKELSQALDSLRSGQEKQQKALDETTRKLEETKKALEASEKKLAELAKSTAAEAERLESELHKQNLQVDKLRGEVQRKDDKLADWGNQLSESRSRANQANRNAEMWKQNSTELTSKRHEFEARYRQCAGDLEKLVAWMDIVCTNIDKHLHSWTWKTGSLFMTPVKLLTRRENKPVESLHIFRIIESYKRWKSNRR